MNRLIKFPVVLGTLLAAGAAMAEGEGTQRVGVLGGDFTDPAIVVQRGDSCAATLAILMSPRENYQVVNASGVTGPPGVIYLMRNQRGEIAVLKCGTACGHEGEEGHE